MLSQEEPQEFIIDLNLSMREFHSLLPTFLLKTDSPRYLKEDQLMEAENPKHLAMEEAVEAGVFQLKI